MPSEKKKLTVKGLVERILEPNSTIKDTNSRLQARLTTISSLIVAAISLTAGIVGIIIGFDAVLTSGLFIVAITMLVAFALGRSENFSVGSVLLVSGLIVGGFFTSSASSDITIIIIILITTIIPAFTIGLILLQRVAIMIIAVVVLITIGVLPLMANISAATELALFFGLAVIEGIFVLIAWMRETSETQQMDEISSLRGRLEERVDERTRYTRIAADIAQEIMSTTTLDELLNQAANLVIARFGFSYVGFLLSDEIGQFVQLKAAQVSEGPRSIKLGKRVKFGPPSLIGWIAENKQQRLVTKLAVDPLLLETDLVAGNQSELGVPILSGERLVGVMDIQSTRTTVFDNETIVVLQMLASQVAIAIQNVQRIEAEQGSVQKVTDVYLAGYKIVQAKTYAEIHAVLQELISKIPYISMFLTPQGDEIRIAIKSDLQLPEGQSLPEVITSSITDRNIFLNKDVFLGEGNRLNTLPYDLVRLLKRLEVFSVALFPILNDTETSAILLLATPKKYPLSKTDIQPYTDLTEQISTTYNRIREAQNIEQHINEIGTINAQLKTVAEFANGISNTSRLEEVLESAQRVFASMQEVALLCIAEKKNFRIVSSMKPAQGGGQIELPEWLEVPPAEILEQLGAKIFVGEVSKLSSLRYAQLHPELEKLIEPETSALPSLHPQLLGIIEQAHFQMVALIPVTHNEELSTLLIVGKREEQPILPETVQAYANIAKLIATSTERIRITQKTERHISEMETINTVGKEISTIRDLNTIYNTLHSRVRLLLGNVNFLVAIYNASTSSISVPYMYEKGFEGGDVSSIDTFPLGEGLTSILIRTKQPLMLVEDAERRAAALGAKIVGKSAKSWLGTPLIVSDEVIGALIVQDVDNEAAFDENDLQLLLSFSTQVAGAIFNARLLEQMQNRAIQLQTAAEVARDISGSLDLGELLNKAVTLIYERFNFYHASIFLVDSANEFAVIREATGEAGTQMKRAGHKLKVGSKSIVGYVTGSGEPLVVNDTSRDATYYANPLLPETRSEVAIPLKIGQRILGALDVQSVHAYSFGDEDINILRILADQMAIAVINSELFADTQEHLSQHRLLHHVTTAAASGTTLEESLNSATQGLQVTLGGDRVSILLADKGKKTLRVRAFAGYSEEIGKLEIPFGAGITGWVAVHQQPQRVNDVTQDPRYIQVGSNIRSELAIPLSYRGDLLGVLNVESDQTSAYNENDEELLGTLGGSLAAIISNARLIEQVRNQVDHQRLLFEMTSKIRRSTDMQTIMATTTGELSKALGARRAQIKIGLGETEPDKKSDAPVSLPGESV